MTKRVWRTYANLDHCLRTGRQFGYPECCINLFLDNAGKRDYWFNYLDYQPLRVISGFIPCKECSTKLPQELIEDINSRRTIGGML